MSNRILLHVFVALIATLALAAPLAAATRTWTGTVSTLWATAGNWSGGIAPTTFDDLVFPAGALNQTNSRTFRKGRRFRRLRERRPASSTSGMEGRW